LNSAFKEIKQKKENINYHYFYFLMKDYHAKYYRTSAFDDIKFIKISPQKFGITNLNSYKTKFNTATNLSVELNDKGFSPSFYEYKNSYYTQLTNENSYPWITSFGFGLWTSNFTFNSKQYCFHKHSPFRCKYIEGESYIEHYDIFGQMSDSGVQIIDYKTIYEPSSIRTSNNQPKITNYDVYRSWSFISLDTTLLQFSKDSLIVRNTSLEPIKHYSLNKALKQIGNARFYKDEKTNQLYLINYHIKDTKEYSKKPHQLDVYSVVIHSNQLDVKKIKSLTINKAFGIHQIFNSSLFFTSRNPIYNQDYLFKLNFTHPKYSNTDTIHIKFDNYSNINAFKYQDLINREHFTSLTYEKLKIKSAVFKPEKKVKARQKRTNELLISLHNCLKAKEYGKLYKDLLVYDNAEVQTLTFLDENNILNPQLFNENFIHTLETDIAELTKLDSLPYYDFYRDIIVLKTQSNHFYKIIKLKNKYYLSANIGSLDSDHSPAKNQLEFSQKYQYLNYKYKNRGATLNAKKHEPFFDTVQTMMLLPVSIQLKLPVDSIKKGTYPNHTPEELIKSMIKLLGARQGNYIAKHLVIFPLQEIQNIEHKIASKENPFQIEGDISNQINALKQIQQKKCEITKISKNIYRYTVHTYNSSWTFHIIKYRKRYYMYSTINIISSPSN